MFDMRWTWVVVLGCGADPGKDPGDGVGPPGDTAEPPPTTDSTPTPTPTPPPPARDPRFDAAADALVAALGPNHAVGVSIAVREGGEVTWAEGFGTADPTGEVDVTPDTIFQIGSTTKQMTATLLLQEVQAGSVSLDEPVGTTLPEFSLRRDPTWSATATWHHLLSHQGGLVDSLDWGGPSDDAELSRWHYRDFELLAYPMSAPGAFWNYANPHFTLAGLAVEELDDAGRAFPDIITEDLFVPLGMSSTFARKAEVEAAGGFATSVGVTLDDYAPAPLTMAEVLDPASVRPAGLVWSTPTDMTRWGSFLLHGDPAVLADDLRAGLTTAHVPTLYYDEHMAYGYGVFVWDQYPFEDGFRALRVWEHGGNTLSMTSVLVVLPEHDVALSILSNGYGDDWQAAVEAVLRAVVTPLPEPTGYEPALDLADLDRHTGRYVDPYNVGDIEVTAGGSTGLTVSIPLLATYGYTLEAELTPHSTDVWGAVIDGVEYDLTFVRDPGGGPDTWVRNRAFVGRRDDGVTARRAPPDPAAVRAALRSWRGW